MSQLQQHSQLRAMGVVEPKTKKPGAMAGFVEQVAVGKILNMAK